MPPVIPERIPPLLNVDEDDDEVEDDDIMKFFMIGLDELTDWGEEQVQAPPANGAVVELITAVPGEWIEQEKFGNEFKVVSVFFKILPVAGTFLVNVDDLLKDVELTSELLPILSCWLIMAFDEEDRLEVFDEREEDAPQSSRYSSLPPCFSSNQHSKLRLRPD